MYLVPLNQIESVDLVIHALKSAGGEADCSSCPVRKVCTKQCLAVADGIQRLVATNSLLRVDFETTEEADDTPDKPDRGSSGPNLRIIK
ncbi:MAG: hypothetical protein JRE16_04540 [Deltaproteobacteria bacterium]|jgi:hypothetical protein|nr:hypothetical protein [Deltaproteobacteria bacterium]MBW2503822.1 hypothetical protein [Deltaproteobacteria bacterium]